MPNFDEKPLVIFSTIQSCVSINVCNQIYCGEYVLMHYTIRKIQKMKISHKCCVVDVFYAALGNWTLILTLNVIISMPSSQCKSWNNQMGLNKDSLLFLTFTCFNNHSVLNVVCASLTSVFWQMFTFFFAVTWRCRMIQICSLNWLIQIQKELTQASKSEWGASGPVKWSLS